MDFRDFVTAHFSSKLDPEVYHTCEDKVEFHFHPPFPSPRPSKHLKRVLSGDRKWQPCFKGQGYPISENSKKHYQLCMAFFFCLLIISFVVYNSGMYNNTHEPVLCLTCIEA